MPTSLSSLQHHSMYRGIAFLQHGGTLVLLSALVSVSYFGNALAADAGGMAATAKTGTKFKADADMQAVLDALAALHGKPIETLDAAEARKQPSPADAVKVVLQQRGKDTAPTSLVPGVTSKDMTIPGSAAVAMLMYLIVEVFN